jgi:hypothetical protein
VKLLKGKRSKSVVGQVQRKRILDPGQCGLGEWEKVVRKVAPRCVIA